MRPSGPSSTPAPGYAGARTTRAEFFAQIRNELRKTSGLFAASVTARPAQPEPLADALRRELSERWPQTIEAFTREFQRVGGVLHRVPSLAEVPAVVAALARERGARRLVSWHPSALGADLGAGLSAEGLELLVMPAGGRDREEEWRRLRDQIAAADLGLTGVDVAIAETGTLVLVSGAGRPRSTALLPPSHVAVFDRTVLVESLLQMGVLLEAWHAGASPPWRGGAIHFITGPSRTADIELTLTRGVHGPEHVHAIFVDAPFRG